MTQQNPAPLIGDNFSGPDGNGPRAKPLQSKESSTDKKTDTSEKDKKEEKEPKSTKLTAAQKAEAYKENLEELDIPIEKAREIMDEVIFKNAYVHPVKIGKLTVGLRTRVYQDLQRLMEVLEAEGPSFPVHTDDVVSRYNVAASLAYCGNKQFDFPESGVATAEEVEKAYGERMAFLLSRPIAVVNRLIQETVKFDQMITAVFAEGAPEDF